jgi:hypothetical protein
VAGFCEHGDEPSGSIKKAGYLLISSVTISFSNNIAHRERKIFPNDYYLKVYKGSRSKAPRIRDRSLCGRSSHRYSLDRKLGCC